MNHNLSSLVTLNLFQGPRLINAVKAALEANVGPWMLKQVQHDEYKADDNA